jgi:hypothetical protein
MYFENLPPIDIIHDLNECIEAELRISNDQKQKSCDVV